MKYILDKNILTNDLIRNINRRNDLCVTEEVLAEGGFLESQFDNIQKAGIEILKVSKTHLEKLTEVLAMHGDNLKLINLYTAKGTADVVMIAYVLSELENQRTLFAEEYTIVTHDKELIAIANSYGIPNIPVVPK